MTRRGGRGGVARRRQRGQVAEVGGDKGERFPGSGGALTPPPRAKMDTHSRYQTPEYARKGCSTRGGEEVPKGY